MAVPTESSGAPRAPDRDPRRPTHLLSWTTGQFGLDGSVPSDDAPEVAASPGAETEFDVGDWVVTSRRDAGRGVVAAVYPNHIQDSDVDLDVIELTRVAARLDGDKRDRRVFTGDTMPTSLRALRTWAKEQLQDRDHSIDEVVLVLSELTTNVERHAQGWLTVDLVETQGVVVIAVTDPTVDRLPVLRSVGPSELTGRGLLVVASLASVWGVVVRADSKTVWAALPRAATA